MEGINQQGRGFQGSQRNPQQQQIPASGTLSMGIDNNPAAGENERIVREQDRFMPIANVARIMQKGVPYYAKISDDAKELVQESVSEFISFITSEAVFRCQNEHRRTITADDLICAMSNLGFYNYIDPLDFYLNRYREAKGDPLPRRAPYNNARLGATTSMGGFVNDAHNAGPSGAGANRFDP